MRTTSIKCLCAGVLALFLSACGGSSSPPTNPEQAGAPVPPLGNIVEVAAEAGDFATLIAALEATGLDATLADEDATFTVFAPTDAAFDALGQETIDALLADTDTLADILLYHVIADQAVDAETARSLAGQTVEVANGDIVAITLRNPEVVTTNLSGGELYINNALVVTTDIETANGIIHVIDAVLSPPSPTLASGTIVDVAAASADFTTLVTVLQATGLDAVLADETETFTVFAPTNDAFAALGEDTINALLADLDTLSDILLYHVISGSAVDSITALSLFGESVATANGDSITISVEGGALKINDATVITADIITDNGIIHVIDAVLIPPADAAAPGNIVAVATAAGDFNTLIAALEATGLDATLADETAVFTVFAPTDAAFDALGQDTIDELLADTETLAGILLYHVITDQAVDAETALSLDGSMVEMANGDSVTVTVTDDQLFINESRVIATDIAASNGIIHVIDAVLTPPES